MTTRRVSEVIAIYALLVVGCGGGSGSTTQPLPQDFAITVTPSSVTQQAGTTALAFTVSIAGQNGFAAAVPVSLTGLPAATTASPASPFSIATGASQMVTLSVPSSIAPARYSLTVTGTSGALTHSASRALTVTAAQDFELSVNVPSLTAVLGGSSGLATVSVIPSNGFAGTVSITISGLPPGATTSPPSPLTVSANSPQSFTVATTGATPTGSVSLTLHGTSASLTHDATLGLTINPVIQASQDATMLYLQSTANGHTARIGLYKTWGGAIIEASLDGVNYVNHDDPGRQIQTSLWDGNGNYGGGPWGYNPIESGDHDFNGSPLLAFALQPDSIYTKTQPIQWAPESFGGGPGPVLGDAYIEKSISVVPGYPRAFQVHYKITHFGGDSHAVANQELPVTYVNPIVPNFAYYSGGSPWTNQPLSQFAMPGACCAVVSTAEQWGAFVDATNTGVAVYTPMQYPNAKGFNAGSTLQFTPLCPYSWDPGSVLEFDTYIILGPVAESRKAIYALHSQQTGSSPLPPYGYSDLPAGAMLSGNASISGWAWAISGMSVIDVLLDGARVGSATYGLSRPDIPVALPGAPGNTGFQYTLDTTKSANGNHTIIVRATDVLGHVATFAANQVVIAN